MQDAPDAARLLGAIADTLDHHVLPHTADAAQHQVRVAANLCRILQREAELDGPADDRARRELAALVGHDGPTDELWCELAAALSDGTPAFERHAHAVVLAITRDKLAVAKPGYDDYDFSAER